MFLLGTAKLRISAVVALLLCGAAVFNATSALAENPKPTAAFIGDSYTIGAGASTRDKQWVTVVCKRLGWIQHNFGYGGTGYITTSSKGGPKYLGVLDEVAATNPDLVVVSGGQNDMARFSQDQEAVAQAISDTYNGLRQRLPNTSVIAIGPSVPWDITPTVVAFDLDVQNAARAIGAQYISLLAPTPVIQQWMVLGGGVHVNDFGHQAIADRVVSVLEPPA